MRIKFTAGNEEEVVGYRGAKKLDELVYLPEVYITENGIEVHPENPSVEFIGESDFHREPEPNLEARHRKFEYQRRRHKRK